MAGEVPVTAHGAAAGRRRGLPAARRAVHRRRRDVSPLVRRRPRLLPLLPLRQGDDDDGARRAPRRPPGPARVGRRPLSPLRHGQHQGRDAARRQEQEHPHGGSTNHLHLLILTK